MQPTTALSIASPTSASGLHVKRGPVDTWCMYSRAVAVCKRDLDLSCMSLE